MKEKVKYVIERMDKLNTNNITIQCKLTPKEIKEFQKNGIEVKKDFFGCMKFTTLK